MTSPSCAARPARRVVVHRDDLARDDVREPRVSDDVGGADEEDGDPEVVGSSARSGEDFFGGVVAADGVDGDRQHED